MVIRVFTDWASFSVEIDESEFFAGVILEVDVVASAAESDTESLVCFVIQRLPSNTGCSFA